MKYLIALLMIVPLTSLADMRMEVNSNNTFCHAVTPNGFANNNDDDESFLGGCEPAVRQNDNGTGDGDYIYKKKYFGDLPFTGGSERKGRKHRYYYTNSGAESGQTCTMVDSNNTTYVSNDWNLEYVVNYRWKTITYKLACRDGAQQ